MEAGDARSGILCDPDAALEHAQFLRFVDHDTAALARVVGSRRIVVLPPQVGPDQALQLLAVRAGNVVITLVTLAECRLDARKAFDGWRRSEDNLPVPERGRALDAEAHRIAFRARGRRVAVDLI